MAGKSGRHSTLAEHTPRGEGGEREKKRGNDSLITSLAKEKREEKRGRSFAESERAAISHFHTICDQGHVSGEKKKKEGGDYGENPSGGGAGRALKK